MATFEIDYAFWLNITAMTVAFALFGYLGVDRTTRSLTPTAPRPL